MATNKKKASAVAAVVVAAALALGGTFAWQGYQSALNEASDVVNPGGRLHDDFYIDENGDYNADVYVENFADDKIFARVQLQEFMEIVVNPGTGEAERVLPVVGTKSLMDGVDAPASRLDADNVGAYDYVYETHYFDQVNAADSYWSWQTGDAGSAEVWYMPTFNKNKDSLVADLNGMYVDRVGGMSDRSAGQYEDYDVWADGDERDGIEIYDADTDIADEVGEDLDDLDAHVAAGDIRTAGATHMAQAVGYTNGLISMSEWLDLNAAGEDTTNYWVYDADGWVYWSSPIEAEGTTGLLLDSIELNQVMDDSWYYAINAQAQFVTAGDLGSAEGEDGFYAGGVGPSEDALILLEAIGAMGGAVEEDPGYEEGPKVTLSAEVRDSVVESDRQTPFIKPGTKYPVRVSFSQAEFEALGSDVSVDELSASVSLTVVTPNWEEYGLEETAHYELTDFSGFALADNGDYHATAELTVLEGAVSYGSEIYVTPSVSGLEGWYETDPGRYVVSDESLEGAGYETDLVWIELYDESSQKVENGIVEAGRYDVVVKAMINGKEVTVYSTNADVSPVGGDVNIDEAAMLGTWAVNYAVSGEGRPDQIEIDAETGKLIVGEDRDPNDSWKDYGYDIYVDDMHVAFEVKDIVIGVGEDARHYHIYVQKDIFYPEDVYYVTPYVDGESVDDQIHYEVSPGQEVQFVLMCQGEYKNRDYVSWTSYDSTVYAKDVDGRVVGSFVVPEEAYPGQIFTVMAQNSVTGSPLAEIAFTVANSNGGE